MSTKNVVLYADDDYDDIQLVTEAFVNYSNNVDLLNFADGLEVLSFLKNLPPDESTPCLIILDINMPRLDGKETLIKIREMNRFKDVPAILFTTSSLKQDKEFASKYNAGFLTKPIDFNQMDIIAGKFIEHCTEEIKRNIKREVK